MSPGLSASSVFCPLLYHGLKLIEMEDDRQIVQQLVRSYGIAQHFIRDLGGAQVHTVEWQRQLAS